MKNNSVVQPLDLVPHVLRCISNQLIFCIIDFHARADVKSLKTGLRRFYRTIPQASQRFVIRNNDPGWEAAGSPELLITKSNNVAHELLRIDADQARPGVQITLVRKADHDTLILAADHRLTDAAGTAELGYLLAQACSAANAQCRMLDPPGHGAQSLKTIWRSFSVREKWQSCLASKIPTNDWFLPIASSDIKPDFRYEIEHFPPINLARLKKYGRRHGATINDIFLSAFYHALATEPCITRGRNAALQFTVDLRRYLRDTEHAVIGNLSGTAVVSAANSGKVFRRLLQDITRQTRAIKSRYPGLSTIVAAQILLGLGFRGNLMILRKILESHSRSGRFIPIATNLGYLDAMRLNFPNAHVANASLIGPNLQNAGIMMSMSGFRNQLTLSVGYDRKILARPMVRRVLESTAGAMRQAYRSEITTVLNGTVHPHLLCPHSRQVRQPSIIMAAI